MLVIFPELNTLKKSLGWMFNNFIEPRLKDEDSRRKEFILTIILLGSILMLIALDGMVFYSSSLYGKGYIGVSFILFSSILGIFILMYIGTRIGYIKQCSYLLIAIYTISNSYSVYKWGINLPSSLLGYALIIVISGILINTRFALALTGILAMSTIAIGHLQSTNIFNPDFSWRQRDPEVIDSIKYAILFLIIMLLSWLSNREIERSLMRARNSEKLLTFERDNLELRVDERTRELKRVQIEKMGQLYRFAEFGKLSSGLFHDLLNPLTSVCLTVSKLEKIPASEISDTKFYLDKAVKASKRMEDFVGSIRKQLHSQVSSIDFNPEKETFDAINLLRFKAHEQGVELIVGSNSNDYKGIKSIFGSPLKFNQVILNLTSNAIDSYEENNSHLPRTVEIFLAFKAANLLITVRDEGRGIPDSVIPKIFEPFFSTKPSGKGTGLGLSTTKSIVENDFKGKINLRSKESIGTIFEVTIPLTPPSSPPTTQS